MTVLPVDDTDTRHMLYTLAHTAELLDVLTPPQRWETVWELTETGRAAALTALHTRATAPAHDPRDL